MLASIPAALVLLAGAVLAALTGGHAGQPLIPADVRDATSGLSITLTADQPVQGTGNPVTYRIVVANSGPGRFDDATVRDDVPVALYGVHWTCVADSGATCRAAGGEGSAVASVVTLPAQGSGVTIVVEGTVADAAAGTSIVNRAVFLAHSRTLVIEGVILRSDPVTTLVPEPGHDADWTDHSRPGTSRLRPRNASSYPGTAASSRSSARMRSARTAAFSSDSPTAHHVAPPASGSARNSSATAR